MGKIELHHVWMDDDIDKYDFITLKLNRPIDDWEGHDILEITSLYHFFECTSTDWDNHREVYNHLVNLCAAGEFDTD